MNITVRPTVMAAMCIAVAAAALTGDALAGPISMASSPVIGKVPATEQVYYRRYYGGYHRRGYAYGSRRHYGYSSYGYGYRYAYPYPVVPVPVPFPLPVPFFGW